MEQGPDTSAVAALPPGAESKDLGECPDSLDGVNLNLILLDLDETLLATELLLNARHSAEPIDLSEVEGYGALRLHDGVADGLASLASVARVGLVTSSPRWYVTQVLSHYLPSYEFVVQVTYDDVENIKPHPEPLHLALRLAGVAPEHAIYVGDADVDFDACAAAGVNFVGAGWADRPTFPSSAPRVRTPQDLLKLVGGRA